jgi:hypothetical protein
MLQRAIECRAMAAKRKPSEASLIAQVRKVALSLEGTTEKISHGEPCFFRGRMYAAIDNHHHGSEHLAVWCRAEPGAQHAFVDASPEHFFVPPYLGVQGWLGVRLDTGLEWPVVANLLERAWKLAPAARAATSRRPRR